MLPEESPSSGVPHLDELGTLTLKHMARCKHRLRNNFRQRFRKEYLGQLNLDSL